jgi:hypothetical protein
VRHGRSEQRHMPLMGSAQQEAYMVFDLEAGERFNLGVSDRHACLRPCPDQKAGGSFACK